MKNLIDMNKSSRRGIFLSIIILFSITIIVYTPSVYAEKIDVKSIGIGETSIMTFTNESTQEIKTLRIWLGENNNFKSFKTEKGWVGEKNPQGVIIFTSSETIKKDQSVKFGIKTDNENQAVNWKLLDTKGEIIKAGITKPSELSTVKQNPNLDKDTNLQLTSNGEIFTESTFKIIPSKPNSGSTIRVVGENFGVSQIFDFYVDSNKIGNFYTDEKGNFITTMDIPDLNNNDRIDLKIKNNKGEEKVVSLRLGENENRIPESDNIKLILSKIPNIVYTGENIELEGTASPNTSITIEIINPEKKTLVTRTAEVDSKGNWKLYESINIPFDSVLGKYSIILSDGRNQVLKNWIVETDKIIIINPGKNVFEAGEVITFNGTVSPNQQLQLILENDFGDEVAVETIEIGETGFMEFEYQTVENEDKEGTWTLIATQGNNKEFIFVGYDVLPTIPTKLEFNKMNYKTTESAIIHFSGEPSSKLRMIIVSPSGNMDENEILIQLREDGKAKYELNLTGFVSGTYTAVVQKDNFQTSQPFSVGLQIGSGKIDAETTQTEYTRNEKILLLGNTNNNILLTATLLDPSGKEIRTVQLASNNVGQFSENRLRIPSDGESGIWRINVASGTNLKVVEFNVFENDQEGMIVNIIEDVEIPGFGKNIRIDITATHKTSISIEISNQNGEIIDKSMKCNTTSDFKCEVLWTITDEILPGTYIVKVKDAISSAQTTFEVN
ncbi:biofilm-associated protein [Nitrosopumilus sp.]|nr:biofilm-associated protein [Nitrosopumilus sp.]MDB4850050.1 biofilm-associated protein [Nitrosopumilus sp.]